VRWTVWMQAAMLLMTMFQVCAMYAGVAQAITLPIIAAGALYPRYRKLPPGFAPSRFSALWLWLASLVVICLMACYTVVSPR
jgi:hypothetical protein